MADGFDLFLSHNSKNKVAVRKLAEALRTRGLEVWLDEWELVPGQPWMPALEEVIRTARAAAVLVAQDGLGPWQNLEVRDCLHQFVDRKLPVLPVLLPGAPAKPDLPSFLPQFTWVDLRGGLTEPGIDQIVWGATGRKPTLRKLASPSVLPPGTAAQPPFRSPAVFEPRPLAPGAVVTQPLPVRFGKDQELERHQAFFRSFTSDDTDRSMAVPCRPGERWRVVTEWDAAHQVPKTGDGRKVNPPALVAWSPKGDRLFTSCDAFGLTAWEASSLSWASGARKLGEDLDPAGYGYPLRLFVAQRGPWLHVLQETQSNRHQYHLVHDGWARPVSSDLNQQLWGWGNGWPSTSGLDRNAGFDPWRPGSDRELAVVQDFNSLKIVDVATLPNRPPTATSWWDELRVLILGRAPATSEPKKAPLLEAPARLWISFRELGVWGQTIFRFKFHPSGEYMAVTTGDWDEPQQRRAHVVHLPSALLVASLSARTEICGWSSGGRYLLCKKTVESNGARRELPVIWDGHRFEEDSGPPDEILSQAWARKTLSSDPEVALSADGQRLLADSARGIFSASRDGSRLRAGEELAKLASQPFAHAAWHPSDPECFVTVGGEPSKQFPDTYGKDRSSPHGRLLRIWRLSS